MASSHPGPRTQRNTLFLYGKHICANINETIPQSLYCCLRSINQTKLVVLFQSLPLCIIPPNSGMLLASPIALKIYQPNQSNKIFTGIIMVYYILCIKFNVFGFSIHLKMLLRLFCMIRCHWQQETIF